MATEFFVDPDIRKAKTLPASFYRDPLVFDKIRDQIFLHSWQYIGDASQVPLENTVAPMVLLEGYLDEPLVLTRNKELSIHCLSNVCTHRANLVVETPGKLSKLRCGYHGRRFSLEGTFESMPEFEDATDFPRSCDNLKQFPLLPWGPLLFAGLDTLIPFKKVLEKMEERVGFLPLEEFRFDPLQSKDFLVHAHWALYCDNYLEGFHIPFVHEGLNQALDYGSYSTEVYEYCNLQIGFTDEAAEVFDLPEGHPDHGKHVAAYYYWVFPNMMFNFYPWGLSVNIVKPLALNRTRVSFRSYVYDPSKLDKGAGSGLEKVEREDEYVVENVQRGVNSAFYKAGRFSPTREKGVHHFHRLLSEFLQK